MKRHQASKLVESLFESWGPFLVRHAFRLTDDSGLADDLVQEAFMALYRELLRGTEIQNPRAWTLTVVRRQASKWARSERRHAEQLEPPEVLDSFQGHTLGPEWPQPDFDDVAALFSVLSRREEEVLLLRIESLKYKEIASRLGINPKSVATLLARALRKLQLAAKAKINGEFIRIQTGRNVPKTLQ